MLVLITRLQPRRAATCATTRAPCCERVRAARRSSCARSTSSADDELLARYLERIPVIALDGEELFDFFVDEADLARLAAGVA